MNPPYGEAANAKSNGDEDKNKQILLKQNLLQIAMEEYGYASQVNYLYSIFSTNMQKKFLLLHCNV